MVSEALTTQSLFIMDMAPEIHVRIVDFLDLTDILSYAQVCRQFRGIIEANQGHLVRSWFYSNPLPDETIQSCIQRSNRLDQKYHCSSVSNLSSCVIPDNDSDTDEEIESDSDSDSDSDELEFDVPELEPNPRFLTAIQLFSTRYLIRQGIFEKMFPTEQEDQQENSDSTRRLTNSYIRAWILGFIDLNSRITSEWIARGFDFWKVVHEHFPKQWPERPSLYAIYAVDSVVLLDEFARRYPAVTISYELACSVAGALNIVKYWIDTTDESEVYEAIQRVDMGWNSDPYQVHKDLHDRQAQIYLYLFEKLAPERTLNIMDRHVTILYFDYSVTLATLTKRIGNIRGIISAILRKVVYHEQSSREFIELFSRFIREFDSQWTNSLIASLIGLLSFATKDQKRKIVSLFQHPDILSLVNRPEHYEFIIDRLTVAEESDVLEILELWPWVNRVDLYVKIIREKGYYTRNYDFSDVLLDDQVTRDQINAAITREGEESELVDLLFDVPDYCWVSRYMANWLRQKNRARFNDPDD
jgi:hypothetical protein